jgi:hypothetical protein
MSQRHLRGNGRTWLFKDLLGKTDDDSLARLNLIFRAVLDGVVVSTAKKGPSFDPNRLLFRGVGMEPYVPLDDREDGWDDGISRWSNEIADDAEQPTGRDLVDAGIVGVPVPRRSGRKSTRTDQQKKPKEVDTRLTNDAYDFDDDDALLRGDVLMI